MTPKIMFSFMFFPENMIYKGLDKEDAIFLSQVSSQQADFHGRRFDSDNIELQSYRISFSI